MAMPLERMNTLSNSAERTLQRALRVAQSTPLGARKTPMKFVKESQMSAHLSVRAATTAILLSTALLGVVLGAAGCASTPPPTAELTQARTLVDQAEQSGASQYASDDLASARSKLHMADQEAQKDPVQSAWMAQESSADAKVALARTSAAKAQIALSHVDAGTETLRAETDRQATDVQLAPAPATATQQ